MLIERGAISTAGEGSSTSSSSTPDRSRPAAALVRRRSRTARRPRAAGSRRSAGLALVLSEEEAVDLSELRSAGCPALPYDVWCLVVAFAAPASLDGSLHALTVLAQVSSTLHAIAVRQLYGTVVFPGPREHRRFYLGRELFGRSVPPSVPSALVLLPRAAHFAKKRRQRRFVPLHPDQERHILPDGVAYPNLKRVEVWSSTSPASELWPLLAHLVPRVDPTTLTLRVDVRAGQPIPSAFLISSCVSLLARWANLQRVVLVNVLGLDAAPGGITSGEVDLLRRCPRLRSLDWRFDRARTLERDSDGLWRRQAALFAAEWAARGLALDVSFEAGAGLADNFWRLKGQLETLAGTTLPQKDTANGGRSTVDAALHGVAVRLVLRRGLLPA